MNNKQLLYLRSFSRRVAQEGIVLLENKNNVLPLINKKVALYGRIQNHYYKSGTGSGGLVNVTDVPSIKEAFLENPRINLNEEVLKLYQVWEKDHPFNSGNGQWASEPWSQEELIITKNVIKKLQRLDEVAVILIGRTAGEDKDNSITEGSYLLTKTEEELIKNVKIIYDKVVVVLNTGNILDLNFIKTYDIDGLILGWHGGQDGARALVDVITGYISPSGKLPMTIPSDLSVYPALKDFGHKERLYYQEDIYVGYRFYETFYPDKVLYAFGYGLSYTTFNINLINTKKDNNEIMFCFNVENRGIYSGKEVIELYVELPQGKLGKPKYTLAGFIKTNNIKPNEKEELSITINLEKLSSYDDAGYISKSAYVLEKGLYKFYYGTSVKNSQLGFEFKLDEFIVVEQLKEYNYNNC